jgi:hypothetical protein
LASSARAHGAVRMQPQNIAAKYVMRILVVIG